MEVLSDPNIDIISNHYYPEGFPDISPGEWAGVGILSILAVVTLALIVVAVMAPRRLFWLRSYVCESKKEQTQLKLMSSTPNSSTSSVAVESPTRSAGMISRLRTLTIMIFALLLIIFVALIAFIILFRLANPPLGPRLRSDVHTAASHGKAFLVGEAGLASVPAIRGMLEEVVNGPATAMGALVWSLRFHSRDGGFYTHEEMNGYKAYHHPGFKAAMGFGGDEVEVTTLVRDYAARLNALTNYTVAAETPPLAPFLLQTNSTSLRWRGSTGASQYAIERAIGEKGSFAQIAEVADNVPAGKAIFKDDTVANGTGLVRYRVKAGNGAGWGDVSDAIEVFV
ncbi:hypothetical protein HDV00_002620 [Rhizophlyctis rosea]|nr:hypothetical protein HDV00_002620 [Rhizophlyctis rosea]